MFLQRILFYQFHQAGKILLITCCWVLVGLIGIIHYKTGQELLPHTLFLIPVVLVSWYAGTTAALFTLIACSISWLMAESWLIPFDLTLVINEAIRMLVLLLLVLVIARLRATLERESKLARIDELTGLLNRRAFYEGCQREILRSKRYHRPLSVMMIDLDNFKQVNDQYGHAEGDKLLATISQVIRDTTRASDIPGRLGGDEFAVLLPETDEAATRFIVYKLRDMLLHAMQEQHWPVTMSIGVAAYNIPPDNVDSLIRHADELMYTVKQSGKNNIRCETFSVAPPSPHL